MVPVHTGKALKQSRSQISPINKDLQVVNLFWLLQKASYEKMI